MGRIRAFDANGEKKDAAAAVLSPRPCFVQSPAPAVWRYAGYRPVSSVKAMAM
jgi:hypothetical protein